MARKNTPQLAAAPAQDTLTPEQLDALRAQHPGSWEIKMNVDGVEKIMFMRAVDYAVKKQAFKYVMTKEQDHIAAGEIILSACYLAGYNFYQDEQLRLEAAYAAASMFEFNLSVDVKKN